MDSPEIIDKILSKYEIPTPVLTIDRIKAGIENHNYIVETDAKNYILRLYSVSHSLRGLRTPEQIELEIDFSLEAISAGVPAPVPIEMVDGKSFTIYRYQDQERYAALFEQLPGKSPTEVNEQVAVQIGNMVGKLMHVGQSYQGNAVNLGNINIVTRALSKSTPFRSHQLLGKIIQSLESEQSAINNLSAQWGLVHGDVKLENTLFVGDKLTGILDFDDFRFSYIFEEAVMAIMHNLHSPTENILRSGFCDYFLTAIDLADFDSNDSFLWQLARYRFVYDCSKYLASGNNNLVEELFADKYVKQYLLQD